MATSAYNKKFGLPQPLLRTDPNATQIGIDKPTAQPVDPPIQPVPVPLPPAPGGQPPQPYLPIPEPPAPVQNRPALPGWDQTKWADASHTSPKYVAGRIMARFNLQDQAQRETAIREILAALPGSRFDGKDALTLATGETIDIFGGAGDGTYNPQWFVPGAATATTGAPSSQSLYGGATSGQTVAGSLARQPAQASTETQSAYQQALLSMLQPPAVDAQSLRNTPQFAAFNLGAQRSQERQYADAAERAAFEGYSDSGAAETERAGIRQQRGTDEANFMGNLATTEMSALRAQTMQALQIAAAQGDADQTRQLQRELADLDAAIQRERIGFSYDSLQLGANERAALAELGLF